MNQKQKNTERFSGFTDIYDSTRPRLPYCVAHRLIALLGKNPELVLDVGCGSGLSSGIWKNISRKTIGIEPGEDMYQLALSKSSDKLSFIKAFSDAIPLPDDCADIIVCSQSFHWMEPSSTLKEFNRLLKPNGVFACVDYDWPPIVHEQVKSAYATLNFKVHQLEEQESSLQETFVRYPKNKHLQNISDSGYFAICQEENFSSTETCTRERLLQMVYSQSGLQTVLRLMPQAIETELAAYKEAVASSYGDSPFAIGFTYKMRYGIKK
ncbi:MAG: class I SAM-dependent methyltransferase [Clostridiales bacterium]|nr:class I SAM-dependent methyltransferase [Clostridiales bacterium]